MTTDREVDGDYLTRRVCFAMQAHYGTGVNAVINDPGPIMLADPRVEGELARMMIASMELH